jgi:hypothetical protein
MGKSMYSCISVELIMYLSNLELVKKMLEITLKSFKKRIQRTFSKPWT